VLQLDAIIIGGGAAGLMAAIAASEAGLKVLLLEKGPQLGRKILISGGGRCNVTNNKHQNPRDFLAQYPRGGKFLWSAFSRFSHQDTINWFTERGLKLKTEADGRVFPVSDNSNDVLKLLLKECINNGVQIRLKASVKKLLLNSANNELEGLELTDGETLKAKNILVACGGMSYQKTGSTGDAYEWAIKAGHTVMPAKASLTGLLTSESWVHELKGLTIPAAELSLQGQSGKLAKESGALLFTHWGLSGPGIFKISSLAAGTDYKNDKCSLLVNLLPGQKQSQIIQNLREIWQVNPKRKAINCLNGIVPDRLEKTLVVKVIANTSKTCAEISNLELVSLYELVARLKIPVTGTRPSGEEIVTAGGVRLDEVDPKTMESRKVKGLYWAGEVLDIDGFTGGYNLQAAWSTGWLAGKSININK
jgi:predicted Rossmann fold flavoprotein